MVAVSGGPDSIALLRAMLSIGSRTTNFHKQNLLVGHVNHQLRGSDSDDDAQFVKTICADLDVTFLEPGSIEKQAAPELSKPPSEETLRNFRYDRLLELATQAGARYLITGHNFDDQVETILFRIFRGTGISGLAGIPRIRLGNDSVTIVRPMLNIRRQEIEAYLKQINQDFRVDATNAQSDYARNFLRNELLPLVKTRFGEKTLDSIGRLGVQAMEIDTYLNQAIAPLQKSIIRQTQESIEIDRDQLRNIEPVLLRQFIVQIWKAQGWPRQAMAYRWLERICDEIMSGTLDTVLNLPNSVRFHQTESTIVFSRPFITDSV